MSDKIKNRIIIVLVCVIVILCCILAFVLGMKYGDKDTVVTDEPNIENNINEIIEFVGDKNIEVAYNPTYQTSYNMNYKINESGQLVFTDMNNANNTIIYNSIQGVCKYVTIAVPRGKIEPYYYIAVITEEGKVYFKQIYAYATDTEYASINDNFIEIQNPTGSSFIGISMKTQEDLQNLISEFQTITISSDSNEYYVTEIQGRIELKKLN